MLSKAKTGLKGREHSGRVSTLLKNIMGLSPIGLNRRLVKESTTNQQKEKRNIRRKERRKTRRAKKRQIRIQQYIFNKKREIIENEKKGTMIQCEHCNERQSKGNISRHKRACKRTKDNVGRGNWTANSR